MENGALGQYRAIENEMISKQRKRIDDLITNSGRVRYIVLKATFSPNHRCFAKILTSFFWIDIKSISDLSHNLTYAYPYPGIWMNGKGRRVLEAQWKGKKQNGE